MGGGGQDGARTDAPARAPETPWEPRRDRRILAALFLGIWIVYLLTATYDGMQINDNRATSLSAWSVATRGTLALPVEWDDELRWARQGQDGRLYTNRFPGAILVGVPFHAAWALTGQHEEPGHPVFLDYGPSGVAAATVTAAAMALLYGVFRHLAARRLAVAATLVAAFATASWSVSADALWTHGPTSLALVAGTLLLARGRHAWSGLAFGAGILARPQLAVVPAVIGLWRGWERRSLRPVVAVGTTSALGLTAVAAYSRVLWGTWLPVAGYSEQRVADVVETSSGDFLERLVNTLAHQQRGVLLYTPFLLVLLPFLWRGWRVAPPWVRSSAIAGVLYLAVQLRANDWEGGAHFFGSRLTIETLVLLAPLLLCTYQAAFAGERLLRRVLQVAVAASVVVHAVGATIWSIDPRGQDRWHEYVAEVCVAYPDIEECQAP